jgi:hypothetical protein
MGTDHEMTQNYPRTHALTSRCLTPYALPNGNTVACLHVHLLTYTISTPIQVHTPFNLAALPTSFRLPWSILVTSAITHLCRRSTAIVTLLP